jgi:hypothetical protein
MANLGGRLQTSALYRFYSALAGMEMGFLTLPPFMFRVFPPEFLFDFWIRHLPEGR